MEGVIIKKSFRSQNDEYIEAGEFWLEDRVSDQAGEEYRIYTKAGYDHQIKLTKLDLQREEVFEIDITMR